ncbi:MAG: vWA domain-containing protein [Vulcanimicrobiaceae bacterium]
MERDSGTLSGRVAAFCRFLREYGFRIGIGETEDALRAIETIGVSDPERFRLSMRAVVCGKYEDLEIFDRAFGAFFGDRDAVEREHAQVRGHHSPGAQALPLHKGDARQDAPAWEALLAKYSAAAGRSTPPAISRASDAPLRRSANALVTTVALGRSRRWRPQARGERFDLRGTLRASLHSGGDPVRLRRLGHPRRNPRFVLLIDGSRSMAEHAPDIMQFAHALVRRTRRARVFAFSTELREITRELRLSKLPELGEAWGGGTRIGATLQHFVRAYGASLSDDTVTFVFSDGLDFGDTGILSAAAAELRRRSAALIWVNPDAGVPGYLPETRGMRAVLPFANALVGTTELPKLATVVRRAI